MPHRFDPSPRQVDVLCRRYMVPEFRRRMSHSSGMMEYADLKQHFAKTSDGDTWGSVTSALFAVSGEMHWRGMDVPWPYSPGANGDGRAECGDNWRLELSLASGDALERFGAVLNRAYDMCKAQGKAY